MQLGASRSSARVTFDFAGSAGEGTLSRSGSGASGGDGGRSRLRGGGGMVLLDDGFAPVCAWAETATAAKKASFAHDKFITEPRRTYH